ncbi:MAG: GTPase ObgE [Bacilli bacterium]|nr:GTPase ObgE [Bacilli bacterium]
MFVDQVKIKVEAGSGGDGITSFRREKYVPMGGPDGGNGGSGGNILFQVDSGMRTLLDLNYQKIIKGKKGESGGSKNQYGKNAEDTIIKVPPGTVVTDLETNLIIADLIEPGNVVIVAHGGRGGRGNKAFATHANPAPNISEKGEPGEVKELKVELKLIADVGLVGMPNVGKSTILSVISEAKPKIGDYHFTTLVPNLGVVKTKDNRSFVVADLPGLIEGASKGEGLGDEFLKHIERTRIIAHVIDMGAVESRDPYIDYITINRELYDFNSELLKRPQIIIANKMDVIGAEENIKKFKEKVNNIPIFEVAARNHQGLDQVLYKLADMLEEIEVEPLYKDDKIETHILYKFKKEQPFTIKRYNNVWIVKGKEIEKLLMMTKFTSDEAALRFARKLRKYGVDDKLEELGAEDGDIVRIMDFEFEYRK